MRKAEFDRQQVLRNAMQVFQRKGYRKTTMPDLVEATGLHPGSLYCAFDNKKGILMAAARQYQQDRAEQLEACLNTPKPLLGLKNYLNSVVKECACCDEANACLLAKAINELAEQDLEIEQMLAEMMVQVEQRIAKVFELAQQRGDIGHERSTAELARFLMMGVYGLRTYAHTHPGQAVLQDMANQLFETVSA